MSKTAENISLFETARPICWAEVILPLALPQVYIYHVPEHLLHQAIPGCRAEVIFGKQKKYAGIIKKLIRVEPSYATKPILNVLDDEPILFKEQLQLWEWISEYYMCTEGEVMAAALPAHFKLNSETILMYNEDYGDDFTDLSDHEFLLAEALQIRKRLQLFEVQQILDARNVYPVVKHLIDRQVCFAWEQLNEKYRERKEYFVSLHSDYEDDHKLSQLFDEWKGAPKQLQLLLAFLHLSKTEGVVKQSDLLKKSEASAAQLKALTDKNILAVEKRAVDRVPLLSPLIKIDFTLSDLQEHAFQSVQKSWQDKNVTLLHGVTGSGKTLIYFKLIESYIRQGKQVLYLLPEIALTAQMIRRLQKHFGGHVAVYHSKFNDQERIEWWKKVRNKEVKIVLGARSSVFLPFSDLGLIIVDEEHDASYKQQDPAPRYQARDTALFYASLFGAKVLLGSGTPSVESYQNAVTGKYTLIQLLERFGGIQLPAIEVVNLAQVPGKGKVMVSPQLKQSIEETIARGKQVILFQNRRGYHPYQICGTCGNIPKCLHCDVSLTLHKYSNKLHCHYCGSTYAKQNQCTACGSTSWLEKNFGTEKIEEQLETDLPGMRIARMDVDSVRGKKAHDLLIQQFEQKQIDILVGTQMVVKGLDFDHVALVGILDADGLLSFTDFRANERAFQLMEQVSGRAGRKEQQGKVLIQAFNIHHPVIAWVRQHAYQQCFEQELAGRKTFLYPPFCRLVKLTLRHKRLEIAEEAAQKLVQWIRSDLGERVVGPAAPPIERIRDHYLREIMIKLPRDHASGKKYKQVIRHHISLLLSEKKFRSVILVPDADPQ